MLIKPITTTFDRRYSRYNTLNNTVNFSSRYLLYEDIDKLILNGQLDQVRQLPDLYIINNKRESLLHSSSQNNQLEITKFLLFKKLDPNLKNIRGRSPFAIACSKLNQPLIESFLIYDVDVNTYDNQKNTPLHKVVTEPKLVKLLLNHGANPYFENEFNQTPFNLSIKYKNSLETFLKCGTNPDYPDKNKQTLIYTAIKNNNIETAELLRKHKANLNHKDNQGKSPLFYTTNPEIIQWLHKNGANINLTDNNKQTVLHHNISENNFNISNLLLKLKADPNIYDKYNLPPLYYAKSMKTTELLLQNNANPNVITPQGSTLLHNNVRNKNEKLVELFLKYKADPNIEDKDKKFPLDYALNIPKIRKLLLDAGSNPNLRNYLISALKSGNLALRDELLSHGANPNIPNPTGKTPVFYVNSAQDIEKLAIYGANLNIFNKDGYFPIHHFALLGREDLVKAFKNDFNANPNQAINGKTLDDCREAYKKYHKWLKPEDKRTSQVVFTGDYDSNDYRFYGTKDIRENLTYKVNLTPQKIDTIIQTAPTTEIGIKTAYTQLKEEQNKITKSMSSLSVIRKQYNEKFSQEISRLYNRNPKGSKTPVVGVIPQYIGTATGMFKDSLIEETKKLTELYNSICKNYYENGINKQVEDYIALNKYLSDGIEYVNYIEGKNPKYEKMLEKLKQSSTKLTQTNTQIRNSLISTMGKYEIEYDKMLKYQDAKQTKRTVRKTAMTIVGGGS